MTTPVRLLVVDDDPQMRARLHQAFSAAAGIDVLAWAASAAQARQLLFAHRPDVLLVEPDLPDASGIGIIRRARAMHPGCDIMVVSGSGDPCRVLASIKAGAMGYLLKDDRGEDFVARIGELRRGGSPISPPIARQLLKRLQRSHSTTAPAADRLPLSKREADVLNLLAHGFTYHQIADLLGISPHTVRTYVRRLYVKLRVTSQGEAIYEAQRLQLLPRQGTDAAGD